MERGESSQMRIVLRLNADKSFGPGRKSYSAANQTGALKKRLRESGGRHTGCGSIQFINAVRNSFLRLELFCSRAERREMRRLSGYVCRCGPRAEHHDPSNPPLLRRRGVLPQLDVELLECARV